MWRLDEHLVFSVVQEREVNGRITGLELSKVVYEMKPSTRDHHPDGDIGVTKVGVYSLDSVNFLEPINISDKYKSEIEFSGKSSETNFENPEGKFEELSFKWSVSDSSSSKIIPSGSKVVDINVSSQMAKTGVDLIDTNVTGNQPPDLQDSFEVKAPITGEKVILGSDSDYFVGSAGDEYVVTGGGSDTVYAGAGDDIITVKGGGQTTPETFVVTVEGYIIW